MLSTMVGIFKIFKDSLVILFRNLILVYPLLVYILLLTVMFPHEPLPKLPDFEAGQIHQWVLHNYRWLILGVVLLLLSSAFMAGIYNMVYFAIARYFSPPKPPEPKDSEESPSPPVFSSFFLIKAFFPGVGQYFGAITGGILLHLVIVLVVFVTAYYFIVANGGIPGIIAQVKPEMTFVDVQQMIEGLSEESRRQLSVFTGIIINSLLAYGLLSMITMFWPAFVLLGQNNPIRAYWSSIRQFLSDPFRVLLISGLYIFFNLLTILMMGVGSPIIASLRQLFVLVLDVYFIILIFTYVIERNPPSEFPSLTSDSDEEETPTA